MPVIFWVTDRITAVHTPIVVNVKLKGFADSYLQQYEVSAPSLPSGHISVQDFSDGSSPVGHTGGGHTDHTSGGHTDHTGGDTTNHTGGGTTDHTGGGTTDNYC